MIEFVKNSILAKILYYFRSIFSSNKFSNSSNYWEGRYKSDKTSGAGSYGKNAKFKSKVINNFVLEKKINTVLELGSGDGNQLSLANYPLYVGLDVSQTIINKCLDKFTADKNKFFYNLSKFEKVMEDYHFDLSLSLDVIYHLVEDDVFDLHMRQLFYSSQYVIIFSTNFNDRFYLKQHVRNRKFTEWIDENILNYRFLKKINNENKLSKVDFYIYEKI